MGVQPYPVEVGRVPRGVVADIDDDGDGMVQMALKGAREFLGMDVAFIAEFTDDSRVFRYVDSVLDVCPVIPGSGDPRESTYCQRVVDGRLPQLIPDTAAVPEAMALPVTQALPVGAHISVPITLADGALYGTLCAFSAEPDPALDERHLDMLRLLASLVATFVGRDAAERRRHAQAVAEVLDLVAAADFDTVFQPIFDLTTGSAVGFEALTRFRHGRPDEWFAKAIGAGLGVFLELATLDAAVRRVPDLPLDAYLAVNLSPAALCSTEFASRAAALPLDRLVIEVTEQTEIASYDNLASQIRSLRAAGARVAVDDAGSGYAGLQRVLALAPDVLKLDLDLIRGVDADAARQSLVWAMTWFARRTDTVLVAEGIETALELDMLVSLGVRHGQGYHLGRPGRLPEPEADTAERTGSRASQPV